MYVLAVLPLAYLIVYTSYKLLYQTALLHHLVLWCKKWIPECHSVWTVGDAERDALADSQEGAPLLAAANDLGGDTR